jgi:hypothetical protein
MNKKIASDIKQYGKTARGQKELIKHLEGHRLTLRQAVNAKCYDCTGFYADGKDDCCMPGCSLYPFMAYNQNREKGSKRAMSTEHMEKMREARHAHE